MKNFLVFLLFFTCTVLVAQDAALKGKIADMEMDGEYLMFADVALKGTALKTQTNMNGNFQFSKLRPGTYVVAVHYLGYESQEFTVEVKADEVVQLHLGLQAKTLALDPAMELDAESTASAEAIKK